MSDARRRLARAVAGPRTVPVRTVRAQVLDVTDRGVNLLLGTSIITDVPCPDSYADRKAGDWVTVQLTGTRPVVLWRLGPDPVDAEQDKVAVSALTWGSGAPAGSGWQAVTQLYVRADRIAWRYDVTA